MASAIIIAIGFRTWLK